MLKKGKVESKGKKTETANRVKQGYKGKKLKKLQKRGGANTSVPEAARKGLGPLLAGG